MRAATQRLEQDGREKAEARADRNGRQRDEALRTTPTSCAGTSNASAGNATRRGKEAREFRAGTSGTTPEARSADRGPARRRDARAAGKTGPAPLLCGGARQARDAAEAEEDASPRQVEGADGNARALSDSVEASDQSFPVGSWVRHAKTGAMGVVVDVSSCGVQSRLSSASVGQEQRPGVCVSFSPAPGAPPGPCRCGRGATQSVGDWVRDEQTGKNGIIVEIIPKGWRTILCDDGHELKRYSRKFLSPTASRPPPSSPRRRRGRRPTPSPRRRRTTRRLFRRHRRRKLPAEDAAATARHPRHRFNKSRRRGAAVAMISRPRRRRRSSRCAASATRRGAASILRLMRQRRSRSRRARSRTS